MRPLKSSIQPRKGLTQKLEILVEKLANDCWGSSVEIYTTAMQAREAAIADGNPLLEAQALLLLGRKFGPLIFPEEAFLCMKRAKKIFLANGMMAQVSACKVVAGRALLDMGRDRDAIAYARSALRDSALPTNYRIAALSQIALCHAHLGEIDIATKIVDSELLPLANNPGAVSVRPQALRTASAIRTHLFLFKSPVALWHVLPGTQPAQITPPSLDAIEKDHDLALSAAPKGCDWPLWEINHHFLKSLRGKEKEAIDGLNMLAKRCLTSDPQSSCWSKICESLVLQMCGQPSAALQALSKALQIANKWKLGMAIADIHLQNSRVLETMGDAHGALKAYKQFWAFKVETSQVQFLPPEYHDQTSLNRDEATRLDSDQLSPDDVRRLYPASVRRALKFIDRNLTRKITVDDVANSSRTGRRTLEISFKDAIGVTLARFIKQRKLERAASSLRNTNCSVREVAESVGYGSVAAFSRDFLAHFGAQPMKWRRMPD